MKLLEYSNFNIDFNKIYKDGYKLAVTQDLTDGTIKYKQSEYTFKQINLELRKHKLNIYNSVMDFQDEHIVVDMDMDFEKTNTPNSITLLRLVDLTDDLANLIETGYWIEYGFISTSYDLQYLKENIENYENPIILVCNISANTPYIKFKNDRESEIILERECPINITSDEYMLEDITFINCEISKSLKQ